MTAIARSPEDLAADAARTLLTATGAQTVHVWLKDCEACLPRLVATVGDKAFARANATLAEEILNAEHPTSTLRPYDDVQNARIGLPVFFSGEALGFIDIYASEPIAFSRAAAVESIGAELGATLGAVFATAQAEAPVRGTIVIADDDPQIRSLLAVLLQRRGFNVVDVADGHAAFEAAKRERPDLIVIDWMMPVMDGHEAVRLLKGETETAHIPVVMLTGQTQIDDKVAALEAGVQDFVTKPFDSRELVARIEQQMRWRRLLADAPNDDAALPDVPAAPSVPEGGGDTWTLATEAASLGKHAEALALFMREAETSEERGRWARAAIAYRSAAVEAGARHKPQVANKLLRLAGKMYLSWSETATDAHAIQEAYVNAARCFLAAGNLKLAKKSIDQAHSYDAVMADESVAGSD